MAPTLWIDVEDLFEYARVNPRPSGIQRLAFEIYRSLQAQHGSTGLVRFVRHDPPRNSFRDVAWSEVAALFSNLVTAYQPPTTVLQGIRPHPPSRQMLRKLIYRLTPSMRALIIEALTSQEQALHAWRRLGVALAGDIVRAPRKLVTRLRQSRQLVATSEVIPAPDNRYADHAVAGDVLLTLGAPWSHPDYAALIRSQQDHRGLRFAMLVYDLIPLRHPEWFNRGLVRLFRSWYESVLPLCDQVFAISQFTAADVEAYARERGIVLHRPVVPIPIGTGFGGTPPTIAARRTPRLPPTGSYALTVATIEARKNHLLLLRVWQRLLQTLPHERVPTLVFAGRIGWLVDDLLHQIENTDHLGGKLVVIENPTDDEVAALYRGCQFTLLASFYEGWGLPVTESLAFGKPCLIADRTSLPEAGGKLARRFDPDNLHDAFAVIREVIENPEGLARWEAEIHVKFQPVSWSVSAKALLAELGHPLAAAADRLNT